jgi:hypothetical protein
MSINAISPLPRHVESHAVIADPRLQTHEGEGNCLTTAMKVAGIIAAMFTAITSFVYLGPLLGLVVTLVLGTGAWLIFNSNCASAHNHTRHSDHAHLHAPFYQRLFSFIPTGGRNHEPHVPVGQGHISPSAQQSWFDRFGNWFSFIPSGIREMNNGGNVQVGGGHGDGGRGGAHVPVGRGGRGGAHVPVGRGHNHPPDPHAHGRGGPTNVPPPSGPSGHVPVGRGHR